MLLTLKPHPDTPCPAVQAITVEAGRTNGATLNLTYVVTGDLDGVRLPPRGERVGERGHELWKHSCFEAFVRGGQGEGYLELNLSPSGEWAAYDFDGYRSGMRDAERAELYVFSSSGAGGDRYEISAEIDLLDLPAGPWRAGLCAVIETTDGERHFFALTHPPGEPDFHHPDAFSLDLPA